MQSCCLRSLALGLVVSVLFGCSSSAPEAPVDPEGKWAPGQKVTGKVTYKGELVTFGYVLLFNTVLSRDLKTGDMKPQAIGVISKEGTYMLTAPAGPAMLAVFTDPDAKMEVMRDLGKRRKPGPGVKKGPGPGKAPPGKGPPPIPGKEGGGDAGKDLPGPTGPDEPPGPGKIGRGLPMARKLTGAEKKKLKEIHEKYANYRKSGLFFKIEPGEQVIDLELK